MNCEYFLKVRYKVMEFKDFNLYGGKFRVYRIND